MISWGETGADVSVACTEPATFDLANVAIDQTVAIATMTATAAKMIILRISCHPFQRDELATALAHRPQFQGEGLHTGRFFAMAHTYRARRQHWGRVGNALGSARNGGRGVYRLKISGARPYASKQAAAEENPRGAYPHEIRALDFFYGAALSLFLAKHNDILSSNVFRFSSNCFLLYYIQRMMNTLLLTIESSFLNQNKQK